MKRASRSRRGQSPAIKIIAFCVVVAAISFAQIVLLPVAVAVLLAFALEPVVHWLEKPLRHRGLAIAVTLALTAMTGAGLLALAGNQAAQMVERSPEYRKALMDRLSATRAGAAALHRALRDVQEAAEVPATEQPEGAAPAEKRAQAPVVATPQAARANLFELAGYAMHWGAIVLVTLLTTAVVLLCREDLRDRLVRILGVESLPLTRRTLHEASRRVSSYLLAQAVINMVVGVVVAGGLWALGVPNAALLGISAAVLRFIPYLGILSAAVVSVLAALATSTGWQTPAGALGVFAVVEVLGAMVLEPWFYGKRTGLSLFGVVVALSFWGWIWGVPGLLVAVPLTVCVVLLARHFPALEPLSVLLGDAPALEDKDMFHHRLLSGDVPGATAAMSRVIQAAEGGNGVTSGDEKVVVQAMGMAAEGLWVSSLQRLAVDGDSGRFDDEDLEIYVDAARKALAEVDGPLAEEAGPARVVLCCSAHPLDVLAAEVVRRRLIRRGVAGVRVVEPPVMLAELVREGATPETFVVLHLSERARRRNRLLARALMSKAPGSQVIAMDLSEGGRPFRVARGVRTVKGIGALVEVMEGA